MPLFWCQAEIHDVQFKNLKQPLHFFIFCQTLLFFVFFKVIMNNFSSAFVIFF